MPAVYATIAEFWAQTGRQNVYARPAQKLAGADAGANTLTLEGHGLAAGDPVQFVANSGGVLPAPLASGTLYYALPVTGSSSLFQVATSVGGAAVDLSTAGSGSFSVARSVVPLIERKLEIASRTIDRLVPGHAAPQDVPYPVEVVAWCITIAEWHVARELGRLQRDDPIDMGYREAIADLAKMQKGLPLRDATATASTNCAVRATATSSGSDPRGWAQRGDGFLP